MTEVLSLGDVSVDVIKKDIKNIHLSVYPPTGRVRISAPLRMRTETIRAFAIGKLGWIRQHQRKIKAQPREAPREYLDRESHYVWGKRYMMRLEEVEAPSEVVVKHNKLLLRIRPGTSAAKKQAALDEWYRHQLKTEASVLIEKWEEILGVQVAHVYVQRMKTKWGGCSPATRTLRLNSELAKKPKECVEYIVVHELMHLLEPTHNARFISLMDLHLPKWRHHRDAINGLALRAEAW
ncbi:MAG: M48 family metallopeptidase [Flavobacteriales bacterium]|nr:M48 family metallopeptidase [Flavobacteriales bacterium]